MKIVAFCPIKLNNARLPGKNLKILGDKPLLIHSLTTVINSRLFSEVYVYCSDTSIIPILPDGAQFLMRSTDLDLDTTTGREIYEAFVRDVDADYYFLFHVTSPYLSLESIVEAVDAISQDFDSALSVEKHQTFAWFNECPLNFSLENPIQTQKLTPIFTETSSFFLVKKDFLSQGRRYGNKVKFIEVNTREALDIDELKDWELAVKLLNE